MSALWEFVLRHGYGLIFAAVLVEQLGAPAPAMPILLAAGALAALGHFSWLAQLLLAVLACTAADSLWFELGRRRGDAILGLLCRLSLEPSTCIRRTSNVFARWGAATLLIAKFVPGLSTVAPPLAGSAGMAWRQFLLLNTAGASLWAGAGLGAGALLGRQAGHLHDWLVPLSARLAALAAAGLALYIAWKWWRRLRALRLLRIARITPSELKQRLEQGGPVTIVDLRAPHARRRGGVKIPGALLANEDDIDTTLGGLPPGAHLVFYCT